MGECVAFGQRTTFSGAGPADSRFASCSAPHAAPARGFGKPCATGDYANAVRKLIEVTARCIGIEDVRPLLPTLIGESGFFHNALGPGGDAGLGQLTRVALRETSTHLARYRAAWAAHRDPVCRRLSARDELWHDAGSAASCSVIQMPWGPARNVLHAFILVHTEEQRLLAEFATYGIYTKLARLGLHPAPIPDLRRSWQLPADVYRREDLVGLLRTVAYNSGARGIVAQLSAYLDARIRARAPVTKEHFNFKADMAWLNRLPLAKVEAIPVAQLTFPEYAKTRLTVGHPGYGSDMMRWVYRFNEGVGQNVCTPARIEGFLAL